MIYDAATDDQKHVQTEMGSKNPAVVTDNADLERAVELVVNGAFGVTSQACTAAACTIVYESIYDEFVECIVEYAESLDIGSGLEDYDMRPHVNEEELKGRSTTSKLVKTRERRSKQAGAVSTMVITRMATSSNRPCSPM